MIINLQETDMLDTSKTTDFPKTLLIRNTPDGMIWQVYHVQAQHEAERLASNALGNGFLSQELTDHMPDEEQTWPDWRETAQGIIEP